MWAPFIAFAVSLIILGPIMGGKIERFTIGNNIPALWGAIWLSALVAAVVAAFVCRSDD